MIIAGAGGAAHLPGMVAALTPLPVIGVPVKPAGAHLDGLDALLSIVQVTLHPVSDVQCPPADYPATGMLSSLLRSLGWKCHLPVRCCSKVRSGRLASLYVTNY